MPEPDAPSSQPPPGPDPMPPPSPIPPPPPEPGPEPEPEPEPEDSRVSPRARRMQRAERARKAQLAQVPRQVAVKGGVALAVVLVLAVGVWGFQQLPEAQKNVHWHVGFEVYGLGEQLSFQSSAYDLDVRQYMRAHLHVGSAERDNVIHVEGLSGLTVQLWFQNGLNADLSDTSISFKAPMNREWANNETHTWKLYANHPGSSDWDLILKMAGYKPRQHDRLLFTFGNETVDELQGQFNSVIPERDIPN